MRNCLECNKNTNNPKFCSLSCSATYQQKNTIKPTKPIGKCLQCFKEIELYYTGSNRRKFCNQSCAAIYNNTKYPKRQRTSGLINCINCDKKLINSQRKYCGKQCEAFFKNKEIIDPWLKNETSGLSSTGTLRRSLKNYLISIRGNRCELCGWCEINPITNKVPIVADHIDGNYLNNRPENIKLLCPNCDSLQPTYKALNKGKGRAWRRS